MEGKYAQMPTKAELLRLYRTLVAEGVEEADGNVEMALRKIRTKSNSGVAVISLLTKPFPCPGRCTYCPTEENMPKSYLAEEPAAARALAHNFDPYLQVESRLRALTANGHPVDKIEMIVIGGTWSFYHPAYQEEFLIGAYRACNDYGTSNTSRMQEIPRDKLAYIASLQDENETAHARVIGLSIETRPDYVTEDEVRRLRILGVTKVEMGVQHLDDDVLELTKRDMKISRVKIATELLRNAGFKMVYHMMPNLEGSTPPRDISMFGELFSGEDFQPDMLKIYPCVVLRKSELYDTWKAGGFRPYSDEELVRILREAKQQIPPYVRIMRVIRDIPATLIAAGSKISNLRQVMDKDMKEQGWQCRCIRCREIRERSVNTDLLELISRTYRTRTGTEYFLSYEERGTNALASFLRLRLPDELGVNAPLPELVGAGLIRELHTYGRHTPIATGGTHGQHRGLGRALVLEAERIAHEAGFRKMAIIAGVGVRRYYLSLGYRLEGTYMIKSW